MQNHRSLPLPLPSLTSTPPLPAPLSTHYPRISTLPLSPLPLSTFPLLYPLPFSSLIRSRTGGARRQSLGSTGRISSSQQVVSLDFSKYNPPYLSPPPSPPILPLLHPFSPSPMGPPVQMSFHAAMSAETLHHTTSAHLILHQLRHFAKCTPHTPLRSKPDGRECI